MWFRIKSYLNFLWHSKNEHGVHSPFVFLMMTKCWYDRKSKPEYLILDSYRTSLLKNLNIIEISDFETNSKVFKSNIQKISVIAKNVKITKKKAELLFRISNYFQPENILEIGNSLGLVTSALALGNPKAKIITLGNCTNTMEIAKNQLQKINCLNVENKVYDFKDFLANRQLSIKNYQLVYFDNNHSKSTILECFESLLPTVVNDSVWIFNDIHLSLEIEKAWDIIQNHPKVTVTIDTFQWGFVFFRREQKKQHFILRT